MFRNKNTPGAATPIEIPSLDAIATNPARAVGLSRTVLTALLLRAAVVQSALGVALAAETETLDTAVQPSSAADRWLSADEAAALLHQPRRWLFEHADRLPFVRRLSKKALLCSANGLQAWIQSQKR